MVKNIRVSICIEIVEILWIFPKIYTNAEIDALTSKLYTKYVDVYLCIYSINIPLTKLQIFGIIIENLFIL